MAPTEDRSPDEGPLETAPTDDLPRLVISWFIVGIPLLYGVIETIRATLPLFGY